jgi:cytochrome c553
MISRVRIMPNGVTRASLLLVALLAACNQPPTPGLARGETLYDSCAKCHGDAGEGDERLRAPAIAGLPQWYVESQLVKFAAAHRGYDAHDTTGIMMKSVAWILDREGDVPSVAQYIASLPQPRVPGVLHGNAQAGAATFATCAACHGAQGEGNEAVHAPPLAGRSDWYLLAQLQKFKNGQRGARPEDVWGATMRPQAMMLDDSAMINVVTHIQGLGAGAQR